MRETTRNALRGITRRFSPDNGATWYYPYELGKLGEDWLEEHWCLIVEFMDNKVNQEVYNLFEDGKLDLVGCADYLAAYLRRAENDLILP